jgi:tetratricopeptide (TPR) repeat protein
LSTLNNLAGAYRLANRLPESIALFEKVLEAQSRTLGAEHPDTLLTLNNLGQTCLAAGRLAESLAFYAQAAQGVGNRDFPHQHAGGIVGGAAAVFELAGRFTPAESWRRKWLDYLQKNGGAQGPAYAAELAALGFKLLHQKKWSDAEAPLAESLAIREQTQPEIWSTFNSRSLLGAALLGQRKYEQAEPLLVQGYKGMIDREATIPPQGQPRVREALERLIDLYFALGKPEQANDWRRRLPIEPPSPE